MTAVDTAPAGLEAGSEDEAQEWLQANRCTDGLPVIVPTPDRVERMVLATGIAGELSLGVMGPGGGAATVEKVAANAVMAGCTPDQMPIVMAAVNAVLQPEFDLGEMQGTTHCTAPLIVVNGPARLWAGVESGFGALGPGHRANAVIGRALRLCMINIGMARPGESDMALLGHGGKFTFCLAENEEISPFEPLHTDHGYRADQSAVTVIGAEPPHSVLFSNNADDPTSPERLLTAIGATLANLGSNNVHFGGGQQTVILNPEHAEVLAEAGLDRAAIKARLAELAVQPKAELARLNPAFAGRGGSTVADGTASGADPEPETRSALRSPDDIVLLVAGGPGLYSVVMPSWAAGAHMNSAVHAEIVTDQSCEIPALNGR